MSDFSDHSDRVSPCSSDNGGQKSRSYGASEDLSDIIEAIIRKRNDGYSRKSYSPNYFDKDVDLSLYNSRHSPSPDEDQMRLQELAQKYSCGESESESLELSMVVEKAIRLALNDDSIKKLINELKFLSCPPETISALITETFSKCKITSLLSNILDLFINNEPGISTEEELCDEQHKSPLEEYLSGIFKSEKLSFNSTDVSKILIDYKIKYMLRHTSQTPILPLPIIREVDLELYCAACKKDFPDSDAFGEHLKSYLHLVVSGNMFNVVETRPKFLPVRKTRTQIWCVICQEKRQLTCNEALFQHIKSTHHQFNRYCWKERYNFIPKKEWCFWKDVEIYRNSLPRCTINGYDWSKDVIVLPR